MNKKTSKRIDLSIIIVNFNTKELLKSCLTSVFNSLKGEKLKIEVFVVDNGSADQSVQMVKDNFPKVKLIVNNKNLGYSKANNQALKKASGKMILLLNNDTKILDKAILKAFQKLKKEKNIDALGVKLLGEDGQVQQSVGFLPNLINLFCWMTFLDDLPILRRIIRPYQISNRKFYQKEHEVGWLTGAFLMTKSQIFDKVGLLDENIFMYGEEVEWFLRFKEKGFKAKYTPEVSIFHLGKGSSKGRKMKALLGEFAALEYIFAKHKGRLKKLILKAFLKLGAFLRLVIFGTILNDPVKRRIYAKAFKMA